MIGRDGGDSRRAFVIRLPRRAIPPAVGLAVVVATVALGPLLAPHSPTAPVGRPFQGPSARYPFGTDVVGRDVLSRLLHGGVPLVSIAAVALVTAYVIGLALGLLAGLRRGADPWVMRPVDAVVVVPWFLLLAVIATAMGPGPAAIVVTTAAASAPWIARIVRTAVLDLAARGYVEAARARGEPWWRLAVVEVLPNLRSVVLADAGIRVSGAIAMVAVSGFLGLGLRPPSADWALMITENRPGFAVAPWSVLAPAGLVMALVVSVNLLVDRLLGGDERRVEAAIRAPGDGLAVRGLSVRDAHGRAVLDDVTLAVEQGRGLAVVGPSGAGKTTFALAVLGALPKGMSATGVIATPAATGRRTVGYVPQDPSSGLNPALRIGTAIREIARARAGSNQPDIAAALRRVGLPTDRHFQRRYPHQLSGGQQQRVLLAMALLGDPALIVLDEPTTGLDHRTRTELLDTLHAIRHETATTFVVITHGLPALASIVDDVAEFDGGRLTRFEPLHSAPSATQDLARPDHGAGPVLPALGSNLGTDRDAIPALLPDKQIIDVDANPLRGKGLPVQRRSGLPVHDGHRGPRDGPLAAGAVEGPVSERSTLPGGAGALRRRRSVLEGVGRVPVLRVDGLTVRHRRSRPVLDGVGFELGAGECLALTGRSGAGKTTVARVLAGLCEPDSGAIELAGRRLPAGVDRRSTDERRAIQLVFQNPATSLNPAYSVGRQVRRTLRLLRGIDEASAANEALRLFESLRLDPSLLSRRPSQLSGGQQQRVAIARALAADPTVLICDEITASLDSRAQTAVLDLLDSLRATGLSMVLISHQPEVIERLADRVLTIADSHLTSAPA
ncbi:peptide/nickel transport system ATP-binding protein [Nocardia amikacinitolerans]|uniref:ABC transporter ATP-binding protein/permease n=1 Tax=Nocardia amikacinitolerans TaxID=756689 RepID=UPI0009FE9FDF|nr:ATP-binding cassette domain-containing protein [Nocardia amikacinitolerans]MCP2316189.1 peptide/nickel transport system ATP-binding protein [Nocardia amikacinitolerans]